MERNFNGKGHPGGLSVPKRFLKEALKIRCKTAVMQETHSEDGEETALATKEGL